MCPKMGFWGWRCENIVLWPPKGTTLREYASVDVSRVKIGSTAWALGRLKDFAYKEERNKNWVVTLAIWGEVAPGATLTICGVWGDMVDVITCAIFGDCRLRGVGVVRGAISPSPIDLTRRPYSTAVWSYYRVMCKAHSKVTHKTAKIFSSHQAPWI